ncbi:MAG: hypothetical protein J0L53_08485 [Spirochaetes bacterium]|nr:hypothetical protein [Spirochaetota bacterium]
MKGVEKALGLCESIGALRETSQKHAFRVNILIPQTPAEAWPYIARNNFMARESGKAPTQFAGEPVSHGWKLMATSFRKMGVPVKAWELPWEWVENQFVRFEAVSVSGPVKYFIISVTLVPEGTGTRINLEVRYVPRGFILARFIVGDAFRKYRKLYSDIATRIRSKMHFDPAYFYEKGDGKKREFERLIKLYREHGADDATALTLAEFVAYAPDVQVQKIRPKEISLKSRVHFSATTSFLLAATRSGLFDMHWEILCPACRAPNAESRSLSLLSGESHCEFCDIRYDADFDRNVEVCFSPHDSTRKVNPVMYCRGNPGQTPHIYAQLTLLPGEKRVLLNGMSAGLYNLRRGERGNVAGISIEKGKHLANRVSLSSHHGSLVLAADKDIIFHNDTQQVETIRIEHPSYNDLALTAFEVSTMQVFRDLFSSEILRPDLKLAIKNAVFFFSDLKDSTQLYEERGDAEAFALVQSHFEIMIRIIAAHHGAVVKTIGDAVMAVFTHSEDALKAALGIHEDIRRFNRDNEGHHLVVKIGLHEGPALALTLNEKLDYFGSTVNKAARIQNEAGGNETVISENVYLRVRENPLLQSLTPEPYAALLKGIKREMTLYRIRPAA